MTRAIGRTAAVLATLALGAFAWSWVNSSSTTHDIVTNAAWGNHDSHYALADDTVTSTAFEGHYEHYYD
ncbi:hypothetical protein [Streptomyces sp. NPDC059063]|uniref:hypothetical protein n=1 Tax=unclassified Streptomyces TaxID=2593676 RepID=UPI0036CEB4A9